MRCVVEHGLSKKNASRVSVVRYQIAANEIRGTERSVEVGSDDRGPTLCLLTKTQTQTEKQKQKQNWKTKKTQS